MLLHWGQGGVKAICEKDNQIDQKYLQSKIKIQCLLQNTNQGNNNNRKTPQQKNPPKTYQNHQSFSIPLEAV